MKTNRRDFLKLTAGAITAGAVAAPGLASAGIAENEDFPEGTMVKMYDSTLCIGCQSCVVACYETNFINKPQTFNKPREDWHFINEEDVIPKLAKEDEFDPQRPWLYVKGLDYRFRTVIQKYSEKDDAVVGLNEGDNFDEHPHFIKRNCMHCKKPGCVSACPVSALEKDPVDGIVTYDADRCIGCRYCQMACPFNIPTFEWHRAVPKISKCDMCRSTINGKENGENTTACVKVCPTHAVVYGKRSDLLAEAKRRIQESKDKGENKYYEDTERGESVLGEKIYGGTGELVLSAVDFKKLGYPTDKIGDQATAYRSENIQHTIYKYGIAPIGLFLALSFIVNRNKKKHHEEEMKNNKKDGKEA